ncbi:MAG: ABC transporter permease [Thaumarchaeota archaeon]|nr:ABC transporter permease [Nitrososphaerota archaeon]MCL5317715.1 ABC transporter permease [Nitrososphaerota archaeon]
MKKEEAASRSTFHGLWALTNRELKKWYKVPVLLLMSIIQPILWMALFGRAMNIGALFSNPSAITGNFPPEISQQLSRVLPNIGSQIMEKTFGTSDYFSFMAVGMLSFIVLFTSMTSGMSIVWDRRLGFLNKVLTTPVARGSIIMSKVFSSIIRSLVQAAIILGVALLLGLNLGPEVTIINALGVFAALFLLSLGLSAIFLSIALRSTSWESQMAVMNLLNLPLLFASNALFPINSMPDWLKAVASINPISYGTDAARQLLLYHPDMSRLMLDYAFLGGFAAIFATVGIILSWRFLSK